MVKYQQISALGEFKCLAGDCPDTCCRGWGMQVDDQAASRYEKTGKLTQAVVVENGALVMKRDPETQFCVKLENGLCGVQREFGEAILSDACYFYPRITRRLGDNVIMSASLSCPETARLMLYGENPLALFPRETPRLPGEVKNYLPEGLSMEEAFAVHRAFLESCDTDAPPETMVSRIHAVSQSLSSLPPADWAGAAPFFFRMADGRIAEPESSIYDSYRVLHLFAGLIAGARKPMQPRLKETFAAMEKALGAGVDWASLSIAATGKDHEELKSTLLAWEERKDEAAPVLAAYVKSALSMFLFPFSGPGSNPEERSFVLALKFVITRLALMSSGSGREEIIRAVQSISRVLDHIQDPTLMLSIAAEAGWNSSSRFAGLVAGPEF